jgi:hypothetical protein
MNELNPQFLYPRFAFNFKGEYLDWDYTPEQLKALIDTEKEKLKEEKIWNIAREMFIQDSNPFELTPAQFAMFRTIVMREYPRVEIVSSTQYGKSLTVARAVLLRISNFPEDWMIVVPDAKRGKILLNYIIKDASENEYFKDKLIGMKLEERSAINRLLEERSKIKLTFQIFTDSGIKYSSVEVITAEARRKNNAIEAIMGFGGKNIIQEEASLEEDEIDAGIFRMLAGKGDDTFLLKIGNPFYRNHFFRSFQNLEYKKVWVDYRIGLADGRYTENFIKEARTKPKFEVLFECRFPSEEAIDSKGWSPLITQTELEQAITDEFNPFGYPSQGCDPADEGENESVIVVRWRNVAKIDYASSKISLMDFCGEINSSIDINNIDVRTSAVDKVGVGAMIPDEMKKIGKPITGVNVGEACDNPTDQVQFVNKRAEFAWKVREWIKGGGKLLRDPRWYQLLNIKYKEDNKRRLKLMSKEEMRKEGLVSPDAFDALALTFAKPQVFYAKSLEDDFFEKKMRQQKIKTKKKPFGMAGY